MALDQNKTTKGKSQETQGPAMCADGLPMNPSDEIFKGRALPIRRSEAQTVRRGFSEPTRSPLKRSEGRGTDERDANR